MKYLSSILLTLGLLLLVGCGVRVKTVEVERLKVEYKDRLKMVRDASTNMTASTSRGVVTQSIKTDGIPVGERWYVTIRRISNAETQ